MRRARLPQSAQSSAQRPTLNLLRGRAFQLMRQPSPLAMVRLRQVDQLEVEREGAGKLIGAGRIGSSFSGELWNTAPVLRLVAFAARDGRLTQRLHRFKGAGCRLLPQHRAQQRTQRTHIPAQRRGFQFA